MVAPVPKRSLIGYARVSIDDQDLTLQIDSLADLGHQSKRHLHREDLGSEDELKVGHFMRGAVGWRGTKEQQPKIEPIQKFLLFVVTGLLLIVSVVGIYL